MPAAIRAIHTFRCVAILRISETTKEQSEPCSRIEVNKLRHFPPWSWLADTGLVLTIDYDGRAPTEITRIYSPIVCVPVQDLLSSEIWLG